MDLKDLGELDFIRTLKKGFADLSPSVIRGIGDDTSVTLLDGDTCQLVTTDSLVQDIHFSLDYFSPVMLGRKALQISLSDIAAMGGVPRFFLVSLSLPPSLETTFLTELYDGFKASAKDYSVELVGGNTTSTRAGIVITTTVIGEVKRDEVVFRDGAKVGDDIYVTGTLGDSALGLRFLRDSLGKGVSDAADAARSKAVSEIVKRHLDPVPRLRAGRSLAKEKLANSMIDISDGLVMDLSRIMEASGTGAVIESIRVPLCREFARSGAAVQALSLYGGEDYELLFTVSPDKAAGIEEIKSTLKVPITLIGEVTSKSEGIKVLGPDSKPMDLEFKGFDHFKAK